VNDILVFCGLVPTKYWILVEHCLCRASALEIWTKAPLRTNRGLGKAREASF
jgi:hypothetical protein